MNGASVLVVVLSAYRPVGRTVKPGDQGLAILGDEVAKSFALDK